MSNDTDPAAGSGGEFSAKPLASTPSPFASPLSPEELITLNDEIAGMAKAGVPLDQGLAALASEIGWGRLRTVTQTLADDLRAGFTLPQAIERQKGRVPAYYAALLSAGARSGRIGEVLATLTTYARSLTDFRVNVVNAIIYPAMIVVIGVGLLIFVGMAVLPAYEKVFADFRIRVPFATVVVLFLARNALWIFIPPAVVFVLAVAVERWWLRRTVAGRILWARTIYALPLMGTLFRSARLAAFVDLLAILVEQKVPLHEAILLAGQASSDPLLAEGTLRVERRLSQGMPLGVALREERLVPDLVVWMIGFGEKQNTLGPSLRHVAGMYRRHADIRASLIRTLLPPLLILVVGSSLGILFALGVFAPMLELLDGLSGGGKR